MLRLGLVWVALLGVVACKGEAPPPAAKRVELRELGDNRVEFVPAQGQLPYCHIFTRADSGVLRQLTMTQDNLSLPCPAGEPVGHMAFRIPAEEGRVTAFVLFSDQQVNGASVGLQLLDLPVGQPATAWNLRVPGQVFTEQLTFTPLATALGGVVGEGGTVRETAAPGSPSEPTAADAALAPDAAKAPAGASPEGRADTATLP